MGRHLVVHAGPAKRIGRDELHVRVDAHVKPGLFEGLPARRLHGKLAWLDAAPPRREEGGVTAHGIAQANDEQVPSA